MCASIQDSNRASGGSKPMARVLVHPVIEETSMSTIQALVDGAAIAPTDLSGLWDTYRTSVHRSKAERNKLKLELRLAGDGAVISAFDMFKLPEAYDEKTRFPTVAFAPVKASL